jgi:hypothetical protein
MNGQGLTLWRCTEPGCIGARVVEAKLEGPRPESADTRARSMPLVDHVACQLVDPQSVDGPLRRTTQTADNGLIMSPANHGRCSWSATVMVFVEPFSCLTANCAVLGALASASPEPAELRSQYAGLVSAQHAMAVVAFNREVDDDFLTVGIDAPVV